MKRITSFVALAMLMATRAVASDCVPFKDQKVVLRGKVVPIQFYGPPNFGEDPKHDRRDTVAVLVLDRPILTCDVPPNEIARNGKYSVRKLEMVFSAPPYGKQFNGKRVIASGTLYPWDNALQHTPVLLSVENMTVEHGQP